MATDVEAILHAYLDPQVDDPTLGFISDADLKEALRQLFREAGNYANILIQDSSRFGAYVRICNTTEDWRALNNEVATGTLPAGVLAILDPGVMVPPNVNQVIRAWNGSSWRNFEQIGSVPNNLSQLIVSPTDPSPVDELTFWLDTSGSAPFPLKVWSATPTGFDWLDVTQKGKPGETLSPEGFVDWAHELGDPPLWKSGPQLGTPKNLAVYTTIRDKRLWVYDPGNPSASSGPSAPPQIDANGNILVPAQAPAGWIDMGTVEGPPGPPGPPFSMLPAVADSASLPALGSAGQAIITNDTGHLWIWDRGAVRWVDAGLVKGPPGETPSGYPHGVATTDLLPLAQAELTLCLVEDTQVLWVYDPNNPQAAPGPATPAVGNTPAEAPQGWVDLGFIGGKPGLDGADVHVTETATPGSSPANFLFQEAPVKADVFVNTSDGTTWIYTGTRWVRMAQLTALVNVTTRTAAGETPTTHPPLTPKMGDLFLNTLDGVSWVYSGAAWVPIAAESRGTVTYLTDTTPVAPFTAANRWGFGLTSTVEPDPVALEPEPGDVWINYARIETGVFT